MRPLRRHILQNFTVLRNFIYVFPNENKSSSIYPALLERRRQQKPCGAWRGGGLCANVHGKRAPLARMKAGDWLIYFSPKMAMDGDEPCQAFTAIGQVKTGEIYEGNMGGGLAPNRLDVEYKKCVDVPIRPLIEKLSFLVLVESCQPERTLPALRISLLRESAFRHL